MLAFTCKYHVFVRHIFSAKAFIEDIKADFTITSDQHKDLLENFSGGSDLPPSAPSEDKQISKQKTDANSAMETIEQMKSQVFQLKKLGFVEDAIICPKESEEMVFYRITEMTESIAKVVQTRDGYESVAPDIKLADLIGNYRLSKAKVTMLMKGWDPESNQCNPLDSALWQNDMAKARVNLAMADVYKSNQHHVLNLELLQFPTAVKTKSTYAKGALKLPAASLKIDRKSSKSSIDVGLGMHVSHHFSAPLDKQGQANVSKWVCPFWLVGDSNKHGDECEPNMALQYEKVEVMNEHVFVPMLVNTMALKAGDTLLWDHGNIPPHTKNLKVGKAGGDETPAPTKRQAAKASSKSAGNDRPKKKAK